MRNSIPRSGYRPECIAFTITSIRSIYSFFEYTITYNLYFYLYHLVFMLCFMNLSKKYLCHCKIYFLTYVTFSLKGAGLVQKVCVHLYNSKRLCVCFNKKTIKNIYHMYKKNIWKISIPSGQCFRSSFLNV